VQKPSSITKVDAMTMEEMYRRQQAEVNCVKECFCQMKASSCPMWWAQCCNTGSVLFMPCTVTIITHI